MHYAQCCHITVRYLCLKDRHLAKVINMLSPISYVDHNEDSYAFLIHFIINVQRKSSPSAKIMISAIT